MLGIFSQALASTPSLAVVVFLAVTLIVGFWSGGRTDSVRDYAVANRSMGTGMLMMGLTAMLVGGGAYFEDLDLFYMCGTPYAVHVIVKSLGLVMLGHFFAPKMVYFEGCYTLPSVMGKLLGARVRAFTAAITMLAGMLFIVGQFAFLVHLSLYREQGYDGVLELFETSWGVLLVIALLVIMQMVCGSIRSVSAMNALQLGAMVFGMGYVACCLLIGAGGIPEVLQQAASQWSWQAVMGLSFGRVAHACFSLIFFPTILIYPGVMQRMLVARDEWQGRRVFFGVALFQLIFKLIIPSLIALSCLCYAPTGSNHIFSLPRRSVMAFVCTTSISPMKTIVFIGLFAAIMSTVSSNVAAIGLVQAYDIYAPMATYFFPRKKLRGWHAVMAIMIITLWKGLSCVSFSVKILGAGSYDQSFLGFYAYMMLAAICLSRMIAVGCLLPILGLKSSAREFWVSTAVYVAYIIGGLLWSLSSGGDLLCNFHSLNDAALLGSLVAWLSMHIVSNRGIMVVKRSHDGVSEQLWLPSGSTRSI